MGGAGRRGALTPIGAFADIACQSHGDETMLRALASAAILAAMGSSALAGDVKGEWARDDGKAKARFVSCGGDAICGSISWLRDKNDPGKLGQQVFFDMKPSGDDAWAGRAFNPEDGRTYSGKMTMSGDHLVTAGCVLGGLICKSLNWTRAR
jgi:uncharacterized protein (DUF2147 family)